MQLTAPEAEDQRVIDVAAEIDAAPIRGVQLRVIALCGAIALLDGYDTLVIGFAAPSLAGHLGVSRAELGPVFAIGLLGAAIGGLILGPLADRVGRKPMLVASALIFALFCGLTAWVTTLPELLAYRFLAGIGLGGAAPCFIALTSEYAPARYRAAAITLLWASLPLGGVLGSAVSTLAIPSYGWQALFYFGGIAPLLVAGAAALWLPESPRFLERSERGRARLKSLLEQISGRRIPDAAQIVVPHVPAKQGSLAGLFSDGRAPSTLLLWSAFFFAAILAVLVPLWSPTLLQGAGYSVAQSSLMVALFNIGAIAGMATLGLLIDRFGASRVLTSILLLCAVATGPIGFLTGQPTAAALFFTLAGVGAGGGVAGIVAVSAMLYPTALRSTGIGCAAAAGRIGQMLGPVASGALIAIGWGIGAIFAILAIPPLLAAFFVAALGRRTSPQTAAPQPIAQH